jgi:RNA polymerase sigma factor (sigma-70 family)
LVPESELIRKCQEKDRKAQQELFSLFSAKMLGICMRYTSSRVDAEDLLHDGFIKVFDKISQFKMQSSLETWMTRVFINQSISFLRKKGKDPNVFSVDREDYFDIPSDESWNGEEFKEDTPAHVILECIEALPEKYKVVLNMYAVDRVTHKEIGELLGITEGSSKSRLSRGRTLLMKEMKNRGIER